MYVQPDRVLSRPRPADEYASCRSRPGPTVSSVVTPSSGRKARGSACSSRSWFSQGISANEFTILKETGGTCDLAHTTKWKENECWFKTRNLHGIHGHFELERIVFKFQHRLKYQSDTNKHNYKSAFILPCKLRFFRYFCLYSHF